MFLTSDAIHKQLFHELIHYKELALSPGKPAELMPGTMLGSSIKEDGALGIEWAEQQLRAHLRNIGNQDENCQFNELLTELIAYKQATDKQGNSFSSFATQAEIDPPYPCAWMVFVPLLLRPWEEGMSYDSKEKFLNYLKNPKVAFLFKASDCPIERTGLYIAVQTMNYEMVQAFLCPEFFQYQLTSDDLKKLLSLTDDPKTRLVLLQHTDKLFDWIRADEELQSKVIKSIDELEVLWSNWTETQRLDFINITSSSLWLNLLNNQLSRKNIERILGSNFINLQAKLAKDQSVQHAEQLNRVVHYLNRDVQFDYLLNIKNIDALYPQQSRGESFEALLASLGYRTVQTSRIITTRYLLPLDVARVHDQLIQALISLPIELSTLLDALKKIEIFSHDKRAVDDYNAAIGPIIQHLAQVEYDTRSFIVRWFYKLLRFLNIKKQSPLHPFVDDLKRIIEIDSSPKIVSGDMMSTILPSVDDSRVYNPALTALINNDVYKFWDKLPVESRKQIVHDPIRLEELLKFLSKPNDRRSDLIQALDKDSLDYLNSAQGIRQLVLETPSFDASLHTQMLIDWMAQNRITFCSDAQTVVEVLLDNTEGVFNQIAPHLPLRHDVAWQVQVLEAMPQPLDKIHFNEFIQGTQLNAQRFKMLIQVLNTTNPARVSECWDAVSDDLWHCWYGPLKHAAEWQGNLDRLDIEDRIDFFDKLSSPGGLTAQDYCDLLLSKGDKIYFLWECLGDEQWATWLQENDLPSTSKNFLNRMPFPLRLHFFKAMLSMSAADRMDFCTVQDQTLDISYPKEVDEIISQATKVTTLRSRLGALKKDKVVLFNNHLKIIADDLCRLKKDLLTLSTLSKSDLKEKTGVIYRFSTFFEKDPQIQVLKETTKDIKNELNAIDLSPFWAGVQNIPTAAALMTSIRTILTEIGQVMVKFNNFKEKNIPTTLESNLQRIAAIFETMEERCDFDRSVGVDAQSKVALLQQVNEIIGDLIQQLDAFHLTRTTRFFQNTHVVPRTQLALAQKLYQLNDCIQALPQATGERDDGATGSLLDARNTLLPGLISKYTACSKTLSMPFQFDKQKTEATTLLEFMDTLVKKLQSLGAVQDLNSPTP